MDLVSILVVALAGALALFFFAPRSKQPAAPVRSADTPRKPAGKKRKKKQAKPAAHKPAPEPEPEPEPEVVSPAASGPSRKARKRAAAKARKREEAAAKEAAAKAAAKEAAAARRAAKKAARKQRKAAGASSPEVDTDADAALAAALAEQQNEAASWEDDDDDVGEWEDVSAIKKAKKQPKKEKNSRYGGGPTIKKSIDVGKSIPAIMGRGGANIKAIREETGVDIRIPRREDNSTKITISGPADGVTAAIALIKARMEGGDADSPRRVDDRDAETIAVEGGDVRLVIGRGGATIKLIEEECGASLRVSKEGTPTVEIRGDQDQIAHAKELIAKVIAGRGLLNGVRETISLAPGQARVVIGTKGATVKDLRDRTHAQFDVTDTQVEIFGTPEQVKNAATAIANLLADYTSVTLEDIDARQCGIIIGSKGATISKLQRDTGASINVDSKTNEVTVSGSRSAIAKAQAAIKAVLEAPRTFAPLAPGVKSTVMELGDCAARVIGRRGATCRKISDKTGAKLDFIDQTCRISGTKDEVEAGREAVQEILDAEAKREEARQKRMAERAANEEAAAAAAAAADPEDQLGDDELLDAATW